jgi:hypothetical protein
MLEWRSSNPAFDKPPNILAAASLRYIDPADYSDNNIQI